MNLFLRHAYDVGVAFGALVWPFLGRRRRIAVENILRGGVTDDPKAARKIAKKSLCHLAGHICEALCVPFVVTKDDWQEHLDLETDLDPTARKLLFESPDVPIVIASAHHGVWEAATNIVSFARPMIAVARVQNNPFVAKFMKKYHFRGPVTVIDKNRGFTGEVMRQWKDQRAALTVLMDQHAGRGHLLRFFGRPAHTYTTAARLAIRTGAPIIVGTFVRIAPYYYRIVVGAPVSFAKDADVDASTQCLNDRLEDAIRRYPEQYLWVHRRWRDD